MSTWADHVDPNASVAGFHMTEPDPDHSTLNCPCGNTFTWSGPGGEAIEEWIATHTPHQKEPK